MLFKKSAWYELPTALLTGLFFCMALLVGCSGNSAQPAAPSVGSDEPVREQSGGGGRTLWGYYAGSADTETGRFELLPLREANLHLNLVSTLNKTAGITTKVLMGESNPTQGRFTVRITLHHPYAGNPVYAGFDVRGIFITGAAHAIGPNLWVAGDGEPRLLNPDGWTRWWNPLEFINPGYFGYVDGILGPPNTSGSSAQVNAFKVFADALPEGEDDILLLSYKDVNDDQGRAVFRSPELSRIYKIDFPPGSMNFYYAVDASWAPPAANPPVVPDDFPPQANSLEAWYIRYDFIANTLAYNVDTNKGSGELSLYITVSDWQGRISGAIAPQVSAVNLYSTGLFGSQVATAQFIYDGGDVAMYMADLTSLCKQKEPGTHWLAIEVVSSEGAYKQSWQDAPNKPLAAYQLIPILVKEEVVAPPVLIKKFGIHAYVLCQSDGTAPAIGDADILEDIDWANTFWGKYGFGFELAAKDYLNNSEFYYMDFNAGQSLYNWHHDNTGLINLYYVKNIIGFSGAYCMFACNYQDTKAKYSYIVFDSTDCNGWEEILGHELSHNIGMLHDMYLLDTYPNCSDLDWLTCGYSPTNVYCNKSDAHMGNIMYWLRDWPGSPWDYSVSKDDIAMTTVPIDSQAENAAYLHTHYPNNFKGM